MLIFNSKLDNSISGTAVNVNNAISALKQYNVLKSSLSGITDSFILQALLDSSNPSAETDATIRATISGWRTGKATGKVTWCTKRGLINEFQLTDISSLYDTGGITYEEYNLILLSKIWVHDDNSPSLLTNALRILSLVDDTVGTFADAFVAAYNTIVGKTYTRADFHTAEIQQFSSIVSAAGLDSSSTGRPIKDVIAAWGCDFNSMITPHFGVGIYPDFYFVEQINSYVGNQNNGIFELGFSNPSAFNSQFPNIAVRTICNNHIQKIYYGAPGAGKSYIVDDKVLNGVSEEQIFRTNFHPDSDYASFVGSYKPVSNQGNILLSKGLSRNEIVDRFFNSNTGSDIKAKYFAEAFLTAEDLLSLGLNQADVKNDLTARGFTTTIYDGEHREILKAYRILKDSDAIARADSIEYSYVPQVFTDAYVYAWKNPDKAVYLVIEEINRGNCAQIFGDIFQLLDREDNGLSRYPVYASRDLFNYLVKTLGTGHDGINGGGARHAGRPGEKGQICLPSNFSILATMNTSDQSLFPMDSAFKRRWDWEFVPIRYKQPKANFRIRINNNDYSWLSFIKQVNSKVLGLTGSEDKQLGDFFIKKDMCEIEFSNKVLFFLWSEICKEEYSPRKCPADFIFKAGTFDFTFNMLLPDIDDVVSTPTPDYISKVSSLAAGEKYEVRTDPSGKKYVATVDSTGTEKSIVVNIDGVNVVLLEAFLSTLGVSKWTVI